VFAVAVLFISYKSVDTMEIYYYIPLLIGCAFIASPITMLFIYIFYRIYVHNIASAFTFNIVHERYKALEREDRHGHESNGPSKIAPEKSPLLGKTKDADLDTLVAHEGGEEEDEKKRRNRPLSREVSMKEIERRNAGH
jgi:hypothetical protein